MNRKKIFVGLVFCVLLAAVIVVADFTLKTQSGDLVLDPDSGMVGVGTSSPGDDFEVASSGASKGLTVSGLNNPRVTVDASSGSSTTGNAGIILKNDVSDDVLIVMLRSGLASDGLSFEGATGGYFFQDGNVGIGTTGPGAKLEVADGGTNTHTQIKYVNYNDQNDYTTYLNLGKSHNDNVGSLTATADTDLLGRIRFIGVRSGNDAFMPGVDITAQQDGAAGATYVPTNLLLETFSATARNTAQLVLHNDGKVGIGDTTPSEKLDVNGNVRADDFIEYSPLYAGDDALTQIMGIKCGEDTRQEDGWCDVDHDSLPNKVKVVVKEARLRHKETGEIKTVEEVMESVDEFNETEVGEVMKEYEEITVDVNGRSLSRMVQVLVKGMQELKEENDLLKQELCEKDVSYSFCK